MREHVLPPRFVDVELVAAGGMGEVYRATDSVLGRPVAVKLLADRHAREPDVRERFKREGRAAARLSAHPNIVTVFDVGEHEEWPYIVMQYLSGGSVHDRLRAGGVEPPDREPRRVVPTARAPRHDPLDLVQQDAACAQARDAVADDRGVQRMGQRDRGAPAVGLDGDQAARILHRVDHARPRSSPRR